MTEIELAEDRQIARADDSRYFDLVLKQANVLASADIVPVAYRGKAADIVAAGLAGRAFGWDVMASMRNFHVIEGSASLRPEAMLGLVRQAGHSVTIEVSDGVAVALGKRADTGDEHKASFSLEDAQAAGLANKRNWKQYQDSMLTWRAVSKLCRNLFSDVVLGAGYVPEEVGADVDVEGMPLEAGGGADVMVPVSVAKQRLLDALGGDKEAAIATWGERGSTSIRTSQLEALIEIALADKLPEAEIVSPETTDAETV
tara:strand:- start:6453 stop:7226 length:774 start_codon:yes stop_codon:yes gene_type:complete